jgi:hypothetical protein
LYTNLGKIEEEEKQRKGESGISFYYKLRFTLAVSHLKGLFSRLHLLSLARI